MKDLKVIFMGTPEFSVNVLNSLICKTNVLAVVTKKDKLVGRKQVLTESAVKKVALENNIKVIQPTKIRNEYQSIIELNPDIIITCA
jgi:methionyl-tRNA formyltransferase